MSCDVGWVGLVGRGLVRLVGWAGWAGADAQGALPSTAPPWCDVTAPHCRPGLL